MRPLHRSLLFTIALFVPLPIVGCGGADDGAESGPSGGATGSGATTSGGLAASGGANTGGATGSGGASLTGGVAATGGTAPLGTGGAASGGLGTGGLGTGGDDTGGMTSGGSTAGGDPGAGTGGSAAGGPSSGGDIAGGADTGGADTGGADSGGATTGGADTGGADTGGADTGGNGGAVDCSPSDPPADVAEWIDASWDSELGDNVRNRRAWLLDNVMMGEGQLNVCVRWGATTAPTSEVKQGIESTLQAWFNDWFTALGDYACFPYGDGISVKLTGWAVRPGNEAWVSDLGPDVFVSTETDPDGEPKCPDACSFFLHWEHQFPDCDGGDAAHFDYSLWLDDNLPEGGAAAVGGDWGLRMPLSGFLSAFGRGPDLVIEHEMGHGFGFQDYYTWTGPTPAGGSLMIVGSTNQPSPTLGDQWLLRRTWTEMQALRGW